MLGDEDNLDICNMNLVEMKTFSWMLVIVRKDGLITCPQNINIFFQLVLDYKLSPKVLRGFKCL